MRKGIACGLISVGLVIAVGMGMGRSPARSYVALDRDARPLRDVFNADVGKVRLLMYVSPTCGGCLRGAKQTQQQVLAALGQPSLRIYVVWAPKNGGREQDVAAVTGLVTDPRAAQYWDAQRAVTDAYDRMLTLTGPCAGIFMLYGPQVRWQGATPPEPTYLEDEHAEEFNRPHPQFDGSRLATKARELLQTSGK